MKAFKEFVEYMIQLAKRFWIFLDGKKTGIAAIYWSIVQLLPAMFPNGIPVNLTQIITYVGFGLTALGLGHKISKTQGAKE